MENEVCQALSVFLYSYVCRRQAGMTIEYEVKNLLFQSALAYINDGERE